MGLAETPTVAQSGSMNLSLKLKALAEERGLTNLSEVARRARVSKTSCYRWFEGEAWPDIREAQRLAEVLGTDVAYLADDSLDAPRPSNELTTEERTALSFYHELVAAMGDPAPALARLAKLVALTSGDATPGRFVGGPQDLTNTPAGRGHNPDAVGHPVKEPKRSGKAG